MCTRPGPFETLPGGSYIRCMQRRSAVPVPEEVIRLRVNGGTLATWSGSPEALDALAVGRLLATGVLRSRADLLGLEVRRSGAIHEMAVALRPEAAATGAAEAAHRREHGCGLRFLLDCRRDLLPARAAHAAEPPLDAFPGLFRALFDASSASGHHAAGLSDGRVLIHVHSEVGRHNAVDKVLGAAWLAGNDAGAHGLVITSRISGEIAEKAARGGVAWVASRSVPTTLAVAIAAAARLPLIARAASAEARVVREGET
jgi:FdhD protein